MPTDNMSCFQSREPAPVIGKWNKTILIDLEYILHLHLDRKAVTKCTALIVVLFKGLFSESIFALVYVCIACSECSTREIWELSLVI